MPTETLETVEAVKTSEYSHKSFELVFANFCQQYKQKIEDVAGPKARLEGRFLGLSTNASVQKMGQRLAEVTAAIGEPQQLGIEDEIPLKEALILSARHLAWSTVMAGITARYLEKTDDYISQERRSGRNNIRRLFNERKAGISLKLAYNHSIRDYFDSSLARALGNDSPQSMYKLMKHSPYMSETEKSALVGGIALEIAAKRRLEERTGHGLKVNYGTDEEDAVGGDLVVIGPEDIIYIDLKSKMPEKFVGGDVATDLDYDRGYKWLEGADEGRQAVVWAYSREPVSAGSFDLLDERLAANLEAVAVTATLENSSV